MHHNLGKMLCLLVVFDGTEKNGRALQKTCACMEALDAYLTDKTDESYREHGMCYYNGRDPDTGVRVHVAVPNWGGKWKAQLAAWKVCKNLFPTEKPLLLFIDSDCAVGRESVNILATCSIPIVHRRNHLLPMPVHGNLCFQKMQRLRSKHKMFDYSQKMLGSPLIGVEPVRRADGTLACMR